MPTKLPTSLKSREQKSLTNAHILQTYVGEDGYEYVVGADFTQSLVTFFFKPNTAFSVSSLWSSSSSSPNGGSTCAPAPAQNPNPNPNAQEIRPSAAAENRPLQRLRGAAEEELQRHPPPRRRHRARGRLRREGRPLPRRVP